MDDFNFLLFVRPPGPKDFDQALDLRIEPASLYLNDLPVMEPPVPLKESTLEAHENQARESESPGSEDPRMPDGEVEG